MEVHNAHWLSSKCLGKSSDAIKKEIELPQPGLDKELLKELLSTAKLSRLTTASQIVVLFSTNHRYLLQIIPSLPHSCIQWVWSVSS